MSRSRDRGAGSLVSAANATSTASRGAAGKIVSDTLMINTPRPERPAGVAAVFWRRWNADYATTDSQALTAQVKAAFAPSGPLRCLARTPDPRPAPGGRFGRAAVRLSRAVSHRRTPSAAPKRLRDEAAIVGPSPPLTVTHSDSQALTAADTARPVWR